MTAAMRNVRVIGFDVKSELIETIIPKDRIINAAMEAGIPDQLIPIGGTSEKNATVRAVKQISKKNKRFKDFLPRRIKDNPEAFVMGVIEENRDEQSETNSYSQQTTIHLDKETKRIKVEGEKADDFLKEYATFSNGLTTNDIRAYIIKVIRVVGNGIAIIPHGGLYFVPADKEDVIDQLHQFCQILGIGRVWKKPEIESSESFEWLWDAAKAEFKTRMEYIMKAVEKGTRISSLTNQEAVLMEKKDFIKVYSELTGFGTEAEGLLEEVNKAVSRVAMRIQEVEKEKAA